MMQRCIGMSIKMMHGGNAVASGFLAWLRLRKRRESNVTNICEGCPLIEGEIEVLKMVILDRTQFSIR